MKNISNNIIALGEKLLPNVKTLLEDKNVSSQIFDAKYRVLHSNIVAREKWFQEIKRIVDKSAKDKNIAEVKFHQDLEAGKVTVDDFETNVVPFITKYESELNAMNRASQELQKWKAVRAKLLAKDPSMNNLVMGGLLVEVMNKLMKKFICGESLVGLDQDTVELINSIINDEALNLQDITHEVLEEEFKDVVITSLKHTSNVIKSELNILDAALDKMVYDFKLTVPEPENKEDELVYSQLYKGNKIRAVDEFINAYEKYLKRDAGSETHIPNELQEIYDKMSTGGLQMYKEMIDGIKISYYNGIDTLSKLNVDELEQFRVSHVYRAYQTLMLPWATKLAKKNEHIRKFGETRFALLVTYVYFSLCIAENVKLINVLSI